MLLERSPKTFGVSPSQQRQAALQPASCFHGKTVLLGLHFLSSKNSRRSSISSKLTSATAVFIEPELTASSAPQTPCSVYFFTFLRKKKRRKQRNRAEIVFSSLWSCYSFLKSSPCWALSCPRRVPLTCVCPGALMEPQQQGPIASKNSRECAKTIKFPSAPNRCFAFSCT